MPTEDGPLAPGLVECGELSRAHADVVECDGEVGDAATVDPRARAGRVVAGAEAARRPARFSRRRTRWPLHSADGFHLQDDVTKPMIFVSAGTGFAPMRAFLSERQGLKRRVLGCPRPRSSMFLFAASGRELRRFNEIALGLVFLAAALICRFTAITGTTIGR